MRMFIIVERSHWPIISNRIWNRIHRYDSIRPRQLPLFRSLSTFLYQQQQDYQQIEPTRFPIVGVLACFDPLD